MFLTSGYPVIIAAAKFSINAPVDVKDYFSQNVKCAKYTRWIDLRLNGNLLRHRNGRLNGHNRSVTWVATARSTTGFNSYSRGCKLSSSSTSYL